MYPNLKFFLNNEIIDQSKDLSYLSTISSWAICGHRDNKQADEEVDDDKDEEDTDNQKDSETNDETAASTDKELNKEESQLQDKIEHYSGLSHANREILGYKTKRLIDTGRLNYLQEELDFNVELVKYVDKSVSLENVALIATPKSKD
jgi:tRNA:m4X modification enzyme